MPPPGSLPIDEEFQEYDAVPPNLGPLIPAFIPIQRIEERNEQPAEFLFNANKGFGQTTAARQRRKNAKVISVQLTIIITQLN